MQKLPLMGFKETIFLDAIMTLSFLRLPWFILVSVIVVALEAGILTIFWKDWRLAIKISLVANVGSALIAIPFLLSGPVSIWLLPITVGANIITEGLDLFSNLAGIFLAVFIFAIPFVITVFIEAFIGKTLQVPKEKILTYFFISNFVSYSLIFMTLIGSGILVATVYQEPYFDIFEYYNNFFIRSVPLEDPMMSSLYTLYSVLTLFVMSPILIVFLLRFWYLKQYNQLSEVDIIKT
jgi:hypothetical protein